MLNGCRRYGDYCIHSRSTGVRTAIGLGNSTDWARRNIVNANRVRPRYSDAMANAGASETGGLN